MLLLLVFLFFFNGAIWKMLEAYGILTTKVNCDVVG